MSNHESRQNTPAALVRLQHAVQLLVQPAEVQLALLPAFVCKADELALDFDHWCEVALQHPGCEFSSEQRRALAQLNVTLANMSSEGLSELWTDAAVHSAPEWSQVRLQAHDVLTAFGWSAEAPPSYAYEFVTPKVK